MDFWMILGPNIGTFPPIRLNRLSICQRQDAHRWRSEKSDGGSVLPSWKALLEDLDDDEDSDDDDVDECEAEKQSAQGRVWYHLQATNIKIQIMATQTDICNI